MIKLIIKFFKPHLLCVFIGILCIGLNSLSSLLLIPVSKTLPEIFSNLTLLNLGKLTLTVIIIYFFKGIFLYCQNYFLGSVSLNVSISLRKYLYKKILKYSIDLTKKMDTGNIITRLIDDINHLKNAIFIFLSEFFPSMVLLLCLIVYIFVINWHLACLTIILGPMVSSIITKFGKKIEKSAMNIQQQVTDIFSILYETLSNFPVIKGFNLEVQQEKLLSKQDKLNLQTQLKALKIISLQPPVIGFLQVVSISIVIWYGGVEILNNRLKPMDLFAFATAIALSIDPILMITKSLGMIQISKASLKRLKDIYNLTKEDDKFEKNIIIPPNTKYEITFKKINFKYPDTNNQVLRDFNLNIKPGETIGIVGKSGSGKTTLINLLMGFYKPNSGEIYLNSYNINEININTLRKLISFVPQHTFLFNSDIKTNISLNRDDITDEDIIRASILAQCHDFILKLPDKYQTIIKEKGQILSKGQQQRICIARALVGNPDIIIFDESTSALDIETEIQFYRELITKLKGKTFIIISHRLRSLEFTDRIYVLENGSIIESGSHKKLIELKGRYYELYNLKI